MQCETNKQKKVRQYIRHFDFISSCDDLTVYIDVDNYPLDTGD